MANFCSECGARLLENGVCPSCGAAPRQNYQSYQQPQQVIINNTNVAGYVISPKSKWAAFLLCFFLGVLGVHRFYVGKVGTGILYLFTGGLFGLGWLVDLILIVTGSFRDSMGLLLKQ